MCQKIDIQDLFGTSTGGTRSASCRSRHTFSLCPVVAYRSAAMEQSDSPRRAQRYGVSWPVRIRRVEGDEPWHTCRTVNMSVSGALLRTYRQFQVGEDVEVEIEFLTGARSTSIVSGVGKVVREEPSVPGGAAIHFLSSIVSYS